MWWHNWRYFGHMINESLNPAAWLVEKLPIAEPTDEAREEAERAAGRLTELRRADHAGRRETLDWLRVEFAVDKPGQKLEDFAALEEESFVAEVRKRRAKSAPRLSPAALKELRQAYAKQAHPLQDHRAEAARLERRLSDLVNAAYGLT